MKKLIALAVISLALNVQAQQDFTNVTKVVSRTYTNVNTTFGDIFDLGSTNTGMRIEGNGTRWRVGGELQRDDGAKIPFRADVSQNDLLKAFNNISGVTMDANASNVVKKFDKALDKATRKQGNQIIDALTP